MIFDDADIHIVPNSTTAQEVGACFAIPAAKIFAVWNDLSTAEPAVSDYDSWLAGYDRFSAQMTARRADLATAPAIRVWLGDLLTERLVLARILADLRDMRIDPSKVRVVDLTPLSRHQFPALSIRELGLGHLRMIGPWIALSDEDETALETFFAAATDPSPRALNAIVDPASPYPERVQRTARALMARFPALDTGLNYWDRLLLHYCRTHGPRVVTAIGYTFSHDMTHPDWLGDHTLFERIKRMAAPYATYPLIRLAGDTSMMHTTEATLTDEGELVLSGQANAIALNGIDEWIGGVHLDSMRGRVWVFDGQTLIPRRTTGQGDVYLARLRRPSIHTMA